MILQQCECELSECTLPFVFALFLIVFWGFVLIDVPIRWVNSWYFPVCENCPATPVDCLQSHVRIVPFVIVCTTAGAIDRDAPNLKHSKFTVKKTGLTYKSNIKHLDSLCSAKKIEII